MLQLIDYAGNITNDVTFTGSNSIHCNLVFRDLLTNKFLEYFKNVELLSVILKDRHRTLVDFKKVQGIQIFYLINHFFVILQKTCNLINEDYK